MSMEVSCMLSIFDWYVSACFCFDELALSEGGRWGLSSHLFVKFETEFTLQSSHDKNQKITPNFMWLPRKKEKKINYT